MPATFYSVMGGRWRSGGGQSRELCHVWLAKFQRQLGKVSRSLLSAPLPTNNEMKPKLTSRNRQQSDRPTLPNSARLANNRDGGQGESRTLLWAAVEKWEQPHCNKDSLPNSWMTWSSVSSYRCWDPQCTTPSVTLTDNMHRQRVKLVPLY